MTADDRGLFVVIEGPDGAGKSTLTRALAERLRAETGREVLSVREPGGTPVAEAARAIVLDPELEVDRRAELFLYLAARADHVARVIAPALAHGRHVVCDRFEQSTFAYQVVGRGLPRSEVVVANDLATGGLKPDLTIVIDLPRDVSRARLTSAGKRLDRLDEAGDELHARVEEAFAALTGDGFAHVDGNRSEDMVLERCWEHVSKMVVLQQGINDEQK